jgi:hypothetical protein
MVTAIFAITLRRLARLVGKRTSVVYVGPGNPTSSSLRPTSSTLPVQCRWERITGDIPALGRAFSSTWPRAQPIAVTVVRIDPKAAPGLVLRPPIGLVRAQITRMAAALRPLPRRRARFAAVNLRLPPVRRSNQLILIADAAAPAQGKEKR